MGVNKTKEEGKLIEVLHLGFFFKCFERNGSSWLLCIVKAKGIRNIHSPADECCFN